MTAHAQKLLLALTLLASPLVGADEVPVGMQASLCSKASTYIRNFGPAEGSTAKLFVLYAGPGDTPSREAQAIANAVSQLGELGRFKPVTSMLAFKSVAELKAIITSQNPAAIWLSPELDEKTVSAVVEAASGTHVLTVSGVGSHVRLGVVLGFSLVEGHPTLLVHLKQARKQSLDFNSKLLQLALIVE